MSREILLVLSGRPELPLDRIRARCAELGLPHEVRDDTPLSQADRVAVTALLVFKHAVSASDLAPYPNLKAVSCAFTGTDEVDRAALKARGVTGWFVPNYATDSVAELSVGLTLPVLRRLTTGDANVRSRGWDAGVSPGVQLRGRVVGIVGTGTIGLATARLFSAFGCPLVGWSRTRRSDFTNLGGEYVDSLDALVQKAQIVSLHVPPDGGFVALNAERIQLLRKDAVVINTSRGALVDQPALAHALRSGRILGAGLDVFAAKDAWPADLVNLPNVVLSPHIGFKTDVGFQRLLEIATENLTGGPEAHRLALD